MANWTIDTDPGSWDATGYDPYWSVSKATNEAQRTGRYAKSYLTEAGQYLTAEDVRKKYGYNPEDLSDAGFKATQEAFTKAYSQVSAAKPNTRRWSEYQVAANLAWMDYANAYKQYNNARMQGVLAGIESQKLKSKQFEQMRKIATEGNEEASEDQKPTGKASVLIGSNIPERRQKRTSTSRDAGTARAKVKVQAKGINI